MQGVLVTRSASTWDMQWQGSCPRRNGLVQWRSSAVWETGLDPSPNSTPFLAGGPGASSLTFLSLGFLLRKMQLIQAPASNDLYED